MDEIEISEERARANAKARAGWFARVSVTDTGCGITPAVLPRLFDPFFTTKEPGKGTGLGLATVYGIIQQHQGWIEVESEPGNGARFIFYIPVSTIKPDLTAVSRPIVKLQGGTETILLVEDEPVVHRLARNFLQRQGYRVHSANTSAEAISVWSKHRAEIDLLLTDMILPGELTGRKLSQTLQRQKEGLKIIYTTGYSVDALNLDFPLEEGVNFIPKPYTPEKLARIVRQCLDAAPAKPVEQISLVAGV